MAFSFKNGPLDGLIVIQAKFFKDDRGFFTESYKESDFKQAGIPVIFRQDNQSVSGKGVIRGIHLQASPYEQGKLVHVVAGSVWDVAVDLRKNSDTYGSWYGLELSAENGLLFYIPPGFGHGFLSLKDNSRLHYKCTNEYRPESEYGIRWDDPDIGISWPLDETMIPSISEKDQELPLYRDIK